MCRYHRAGFQELLSYRVYLFVCMCRVVGGRQGQLAGVSFLSSTWVLGITLGSYLVPSIFTSESSIGYTVSILTFVFNV